MVSLSTKLVLLLALVVVLQTVAVPRIASACTCRTLDIRTWPPADIAAPTNAIIRIAVNQGAALVKWPLRRQVFAIKDEHGDTVQARRRDLGAAEVHWIELMPKARLQRNTGYRMVVQNASGDWATVGTFRTGAAADTNPPPFAGFVRAVAVKEPYQGGLCGTGELYADLELARGSEGGPADEAEAAQATLYAVWFGPARTNETRLPLTYFRSIDGRLLPGHASKCWPADMVFHPRHGWVSLTFRAVDMAGNRSEPRQVEIDMRSPAKTMQHD
jgi:hypothetical protein